MRTVFTLLNTLNFTATLSNAPVQQQSQTRDMGCEDTEDMEMNKRGGIGSLSKVCEG